MAAYRCLLVNQELLIRTQITDIWVRSFTHMNILILRFKEAEDISVILIRKKRTLGIWERSSQQLTYPLLKRNISFLEVHCILIPSWFHALLQMLNIYRTAPALNYANDQTSSNFFWVWKQFHSWTELSKGDILYAKKRLLHLLSGTVQCRTRGLQWKSSWQNLHGLWKTCFPFELALNPKHLQ